MDHLTNSIKNTINVIDGYTTGTLIVDGEFVGLLLEDGSELPLDNNRHIEVRNGDGSYERVMIDQIQTTMTAEGWPLYAGMYARVK
ncbi:hypothetical protein MHB43_10440 [Paenibacillus sp. FSL H8-0317]|uniref:hypothetical protein n=1 Tax=Paenibacillus sp. FSL H8-0317 TaxID=2921385 RepID=UPI003251154C